MENISYVDEVVNTSGLLNNAVEHAELLLSYATEHGLEIDREWVSSIIESKRLKENKHWTVDSEIKFWMAYKSLSKTVQPVSVESLLATEREIVVHPNFFQRLLKIKSRLSFSRRSVRYYILTAAAFMTALLFIQIFSLKGTTLLNNIQINSARIDEITLRDGELRLLLNADATNQSATQERYRLESEKSQLDQEIRGSIELLEPWVKTLRRFAFLSPKVDNATEKSTQVKASSANTDSGPPPIPSGENIAEMDMNTQIGIIQEAQNFTQIIQLYLLPLLYGLIGGFVFVLRSLTNDIKNLVFSHYSDIKYSLRIILGALAGLIVGLLWGDIENQQISFLKSLSNSGFAFIAGYGVEYLFDGIDRLVGSIGKKKSE